MVVNAVCQRVGRKEMGGSLIGQLFEFGRKFPSGPPPPSPHMVAVQLPLDSSPDYVT